MSSELEQLQQAETRTARLADLFPDEIEFFKRRFIWSSNTRGCYTRHQYEEIELPGFGILPKWRPLKSRGNWQTLYQELVDSLVEKHLDFERFQRTRNLKDRLASPDHEVAFWLGTMAGARTFNDCIDLDSHDTIAWRYVPTRWHPENFHSFGGPHDDRELPVVRPSLKFFQIAKLIYDNFPNRIWAFSSGNCGLGVWKVYEPEELTHVVYRRIGNQLKAAGLPDVEHYPRPAKSKGSLGKTHRRPCGMDSAIITNDGLLTDPIEQIRAFMSPPKTPSFDRIVNACIASLQQSYEGFLTSGASLDHERLSADDKQDLVDDCEEIIGDILTWLATGCPMDWTLIRQDQKEAEPQTNEPALVFESDHFSMLGETVVLPDSTLPDGDYPEAFWQADLKAIAGSGQWVQFIHFLIHHGFPVEDKFEKVVTPLALWFGFVELFGEDRDRIKQVIKQFVLTRHNGKITRLLTGQTTEALSHVDRIVDRVLDHEDDQGKQLFALIRQKRSSGQYKHVYRFESEIMGTRQADSSSTKPEQQKQFYLTCGGLIDPDPQSDWVYEADLTPLPDDVLNRIRDAFRQAKRQLRRNKTTGRYPTLDAITRFFNYLLSGRKSGTRRASQKLLVQMGFQSNNKKRGQIIKVLTDARLIHKGSYRSKTKSRRWHLDKTVIRIMHEERQQQSAAS